MASGVVLDGGKKDGDYHVLSRGGTDGPHRREEESISVCFSSGPLKEITERLVI